MSKPHPTQTGLSRRTALAGVLALAGSATPALAVPATPDDAELLRVVQAGLEAYAAFERLCHEWRNEVCIPDHVVQQETELMDTVCTAQAKAGYLIASTRAGLQAKARLAVVRMTLNAEGEAQPDNPDYLAWSLCRDLLGVAA